MRNMTQAEEKEGLDCLNLGSKEGGVNSSSGPRRWPRLSKDVVLMGVRRPRQAQLQVGGLSRCWRGLGHAL